MAVKKFSRTPGVESNDLPDVNRISAFYGMFHPNNS